MPTTASGTLTNVNDVVILTPSRTSALGPDAQLGIALSGSFTGASVIVEAIMVSGDTPVPKLYFSGSTYVPVQGVALALTDATAVTLSAAIGAEYQIQIRLTAITSNSITVSMSAQPTGVSPGAGGVVVVSIPQTSVFAAGFTMNGATTANVISIPDNLADALNVKEGSTSYLKFVTTNSSEGIVTGKKLTVTAAVAGALSVGPNGATNPALSVDGSTASAATGWKITGAAAAGGAAMAVISSGTNENGTIDAKGSGTITIGGISTGNVNLGGGGGRVVLPGTLTAGGLLTCALQIATSGPLIYSGSGAPTISAAVKGSLYLRTDGSTTSDRLYVATNTSGTWTSVTCAA